jgi:hypothetical protein
MAVGRQLDGFRSAGLAAPLEFLNCTTFHQWVAHKFTQNSI